MAAAAGCRFNRRAFGRQVGSFVEPIQSVPGLQAIKVTLAPACAPGDDPRVILEAVMKDRGLNYDSTQKDWGQWMVEHLSAGGLSALLSADLLRRCRCRVGPFTLRHHVPFVFPHKSEQRNTELDTDAPTTRLLRQVTCRNARRQPSRRGDAENPEPPQAKKQRTLVDSQLEAEACGARRLDQQATVIGLSRFQSMRAESAQPALSSPMG